MKDELITKEQLAAFKSTLTELVTTTLTLFVERFDRDVVNDTLFHLDIDIKVGYDKKFGLTEDTIIQFANKVEVFEQNVLQAYQAQVTSVIDSLNNMTIFMREHKI